MKFTELKADIQQGARPIYLLEGTDSYFMLHAEQQIKSAFLEMEELNFATFDGASLKGNGYNALTTAVQAFPFMSQKRIVKVTDLCPTEGDFKAYLQPLFDNFPESSILLIVNSNPKKGGVDLKRKKAVTYVDCNKADEETVVKWIYFTCKRANVVANVDCCTAIARYCLCDMARVSKEVEKLIEYQKEGTLTMDTVNNLVYRDAEYRIYEMTNTLSRKDYASFVAISQDLLLKGNDELSLLSSLFSYFKNMLTCLASNESDIALADRLKMKEYAVKKTREQARVFGKDKLMALTDGIYQKISAVKCGELTPQSAWQIVTNQLFFGI